MTQVKNTKEGSVDYRINNPVDLEDIERWETSDIADLPMGQINCFVRLAETRKRFYKILTAKLDDALRGKTNGRLDMARGGPYGTARVEIDEHCVVSKVDKKVTWDQKKLDEAVKKIRGLGASDILDGLISLTYKVDERAYRKLPSVYQTFLNDARTVSRGSEKLEIQTPGNFIRVGEGN